MEQPQELFRSLEPRQFEILVELLYERMGYETTLTPYTNDGGKDIIAVSNQVGRKEIIYIECKNSSKGIGPKIIRALVGIVTNDRATKGVVVSSSYFTRQAKRKLMKTG
jgi:restriction system protein